MMLYPVAVTRYDAVVAPRSPSLLVRPTIPAYASLGFWAAAKLVLALATLSLAIFRRGAARGYAAFFGSWRSSSCPH